jgi:NAD(P)-dependent dehydrogenase (short-subunit alcohol dehydrogenase family)
VTRGVGHVGGGAAIDDVDGRIGTGRQEQLDHLDVAVLGGFMERGKAPVLCRVDIGSGGKQHATDFEVPPRGGRVERLVGECVRGVRADRRACIEQGAGDLGLPEERGEMERGEPVGRERPNGGGIIVERGTDAIDTAERRAFEDVKVGVAGEERIHRRSVKPVPRQQDRRYAVLTARVDELRILRQQRAHPLAIACGDRRHHVRGAGHPRSLPQHPARGYDAREKEDQPGMRLADKVSIITGGGGGMGRVAARMFAEQGAKVVVAEFGQAAGRETVDQITQAGGQATFVQADVSKEADAKAMVDHAVATYGRLDVIYNNAGVMPEADHSVTDTSVDVWDQVMAVNVRGVFLGCKYAIPAMEAAGGGSIINIASFVALVGCSVPQDAYTASKGAVLSLTRSLAVQFGPKGIRTNAICPGPVETPLLMDWLVKDEEAKRIRLARNPTGRFGKPEEIVHMAVYLASDESRWTNGASLVVDGGITVNYF